MKVFIKESVHTGAAMLHFSVLRIFIRRRGRARRVVVGNIGRILKATTENFEQVEQSGIEWSFGDLVE